MPWQWQGQGTGSNYNNPHRSKLLCLHVQPESINLLAPEAAEHWRDQRWCAPVDGFLFRFVSKRGLWAILRFFFGISPQIRAAQSGQLRAVGLDAELWVCWWRWRGGFTSHRQDNDNKLTAVLEDASDYGRLWGQWEGHHGTTMGRAQKCSDVLHSLQRVKVWTTHPPL